MTDANLFGEPLVPGLNYADEIISGSEQEALVTEICATDLTPFRFHGWLGKRKTKTYGWHYDFDDASFTPTEPMPPWLLPLRAKAAAFAHVDEDEFVHALVARYDPGAAIGWHRDRPQFELVTGISLCSEASMRFRRRVDGGFRRAKLNLRPRSAYSLSAASRWEWEHSIPPGNSLRFSITFRTLSAKGRSIAAEH